MAAVAYGERSLTPGIDAFNASVPVDYAKSAAFSPLSFEYDCCVFAEALDPIGRANVSEKLAVMTDFTGAYYPILDAFESMPPSDRLLFSSARTIGVSEISKVNADFKRRVFGTRMNASISLSWPTRGAENWIKAKLDGRMEDFAMPIGKIGHDKYSIVDAAVVMAELPPDAACVSVEEEFRVSPDETKKIPFLKFRSKVDFARTAEKVVLRVPLRGGAFLYLMTPGETKTLADVRKTVTGESILSCTLEPLDATAKGTGSAICELSIPAFDMLTSTEMEKGFEELHIQKGEITYLYPALTGRSAFQSVRFVLGKGDVPDDAVELPAATMKAAFNRPFMFFVYCPDTNTIPVIGQFAGEL